MLKDAFHASKSLNHICPVIVQIPELAVMFLMSPPEGILLQKLILLELLPDSPAFVISKGEPVLLEESVDTRNTVVPAFLKIVKSKSPVLRFCLLAFDGILSPDSLAVNKLGVPCLDVSVEIGNELILFMGHTCSEVGEALFCLLRKSEVGLRNKNVAHGKHTKAS